MFWLFTQIWVWLIVAVLLGALACLLFLVRPLDRRIAAFEAPDEQAPPPVTP